MLASQLSIPYEHVLALTRRQPALLTMAPEALKYKIGLLASELGISNPQALVMAARRMSVLEASPQTIMERCQLLGQLVEVAPEQVRPSKAATVLLAGGQAEQPAAAASFWSPPLLPPQAMLIAADKPLAQTHMPAVVDQHRGCHCCQQLSP